MIYEFIIFGLTGGITIILGFRYNSRKNKVYKNLLIYVCIFASSNLSAAISRILRYTGAWEVSADRYLELLAVTVCLIALSNVFFLRFGIEIFHEKLSKSIKLLINVSYSVLTIAYIVFSLMTGLYVVDLTELIWGFLIAQSLIVIIYIFVSSFLLARRIDDPVDKAFVSLLAFSPVCIIMIFALFLLDRIMGGNFTIFYYLGWLMGVFASIILYFSVARPKFVEKMIEKRVHSKSNIEPISH